MATPSRGQKRVRFSDQPQIVEFEPALPRDDDAVEELEGGINAVRLDNKDPSMAAIQRAKRRKDVLLREFEDVAGDGEADYDSVPLSSRLEHAVRLEPFHLKREREEGYFDEETGTYVRHRVAAPDVEDAWADALPALEDEGESSSSSDTDEETVGQLGPESDEDPAALRQIILQALRPGETILAALRRIGRQRQEPASSVSIKRAALTPEAAAAFERLTDAGAKLMRQSGDFGLYSRTREQIHGRAKSGRLATTAVGQLPTQLAGAPAPRMDLAPSQGEPEVDMFAAEDVAAEQHSPTGANMSVPPSPGMGTRDRDGHAVGSALASSTPPQGHEGIPPRIPDGFHPDPITGVWINARLGCTFDPSTQVYGDIGTGMRYLWRDGQYHPLGLT